MTAGCPCSRYCQASNIGKIAHLSGEMTRPSRQTRILLTYDERPRERSPGVDAIDSTPHARAGAVRCIVEAWKD